MPQDLHRRASAARKAACAEFARERTLIAAPHLPFPGIGYLRADANGGCDWVPVDYTNRKGDQGVHLPACDAGEADASAVCGA